MTDGNTLFTAGSYKGLSYKDVQKKNPSYYKFLCDRNIRSNDAPGYRNYIEQRLANVGEETIRRGLNTSDIVGLLCNYPTFKQIIGQPQITRIGLGYSYERPGQFPATHYGQFIDYLIRHRLCSLTGQIASDRRADATIGSAEKPGCISVYQPSLDDMEEITLDEVGNFDNEVRLSEVDGVVKFFKVTNEIVDKKLQALRQSYEIFKTNPNTGSILSHIYNTSMGHTAFFGHKVEDPMSPDLEASYFVPDEMYSDLMRYLDQFTGKQIQCNPAVGNDRIKGDADLIIDDELIDIKTSKNEIGQYISDFYQLFIYAGLVYKQDGRLLRKLTIYNPLLGYSRSVDISKVDIVGLWEYLERVVV